MIKKNKPGNFLLDLLFPKYCISCKKIDFWICEDCLSKLPIKYEHFCPCCEKNITPGGMTCFSCKPKYPLDGILAAASYDEEMISNAIHNYKYRFVSELHVELGEIVSRSIITSPMPIPDIIIPVPLHPRRLRWRGFNQSSLLAKIVASKIAPGIEIPIDEKSLMRKRYTRPQMQLKNSKQRVENISEAFFWKGKAIQGKIILIIDDVATTGATLCECSRILKTAGAKEVYAAVIARQENKKFHNK
jgi:ComF family protein